MSNYYDMWDDFCYVCSKGCDEYTGSLGFCNNCPHVFHARCHVPTIEGSMENLSNKWQCSICVPCEPITEVVEGFGEREQLLCAKLYLACFKENNQVDLLLNKVPTTDLDYYSLIKQPIWLYAISEKIKILQYTKISEFVDDMNLLFQNFSTFIPPDSDLANTGINVYYRFVNALSNYLPAYENKIWKYVSLYNSQAQTNESDLRPNSSDTISTITCYLMKFIVMEIDRAFSKKAIESLVKKLKEKDDQLDALLIAISTLGRVETNCITIKGNKTREIKIAGIKEFPHVVYANIFRWPDLHKNALEHRSICLCAFDLKTEQICINPYHYIEKEYTVEAIINSKPGSYLIKWHENDDPSDYTWEPIENFDQCQDLVMEFKETYWPEAQKLMCRINIQNFFDIGEEYLRQEFKPYGPIKLVEICRDRTIGNDNVSAFIEYEVPEAAQIARDCMNGKMMGGGPIIVSPASELTRPQDMSMSKTQSIIDTILDDGSKFHRVYVSSVHYTYLEYDMRQKMEHFGEIIQCIMPKADSGKHRGFGYIEFTTPNAANKAVQNMNGYKYGGESWVLCRAITPPDALNISSNIFNPQIVANVSIEDENDDTDDDDDRINYTDEQFIFENMRIEIMAVFMVVAAPANASAVLVLEEDSYADDVAGEQMINGDKTKEELSVLAVNKKARRKQYMKEYIKRKRAEMSEEERRKYNSDGSIRKKKHRNLKIK